MRLTAVGFQSSWAGIASKRVISDRRAGTDGSNRVPTHAAANKSPAKAKTVQFEMTNHFVMFVFILVYLTASPAIRHRRECGRTHRLRHAGPMRADCKQDAGPG